jgi:hypothetical protein
LPDERGNAFLLLYFAWPFFQRYFVFSAFKGAAQESGCMKDYGHLRGMVMSNTNSLTVVEGLGFFDPFGLVKYAFIVTEQLPELLMKMLSSRLMTSCRQYLYSYLSRAQVPEQYGDGNRISSGFRT